MSSSFLGRSELSRVPDGTAAEEDLAVSSVRPAHKDRSTVRRKHISKNKRMFIESRRNNKEEHFAGLARIRLQTCAGPILTTRILRAPSDHNHVVVRPNQVSIGQQHGCLLCRRCCGGMLNALDP
jgi:hypothetical protein